jgi:hypothetical protein
MKIFCALAFVFLLAANLSAQRSVKGRVLTSKAAPEIRLKFDKKFKFAGSQEFTLYDRAKAEQFFFVDSEKGKIKRLYMLQFESFLPGIDAQYNYNEPRTIEIGGLKYFSNFESIPSIEAALKALPPDSDAARAVKFLQDKEFTLPKALKFQRFVSVLDDAKRSEFIILYIEDSEMAESTDLQKKALANFKVIR